MKDFDEIERLLMPAVSSSPELRERLLRETTRTVRRWKWTRRLVRASALAACYAAGMLTIGAIWQTRPEPETRIVVVREAVETSPKPDVPPLMQSPREMELAAEQRDGSESVKLYLEAGRRYGRDFNDWASAMRCYRNALDLAGRELPAADATNDDWLLAKMKTERRESNGNP